MESEREMDDEFLAAAAIAHRGGESVCVKTVSTGLPRQKRPTRTILQNETAKR